VKRPGVAVWVLVLLEIPRWVGAQCVGDCNNNGSVTAGELTKVISIINLCDGVAVGCAAIPGSDKQCTNADRNGNGVISAGELTLVISNINSFASGCPPVSRSATPSPTTTTSPTPSPTATGTPTPGEPLGTRTFLLNSTTSGFYSSLATGKIGTLKKSALVLTAGPLDANGHASVTVVGPVLVQTNVAVGGTSLCTMIESCTGTLYCNAGTNVDVSESVDSLQGGVACVQNGTNMCPASASNVCCSNSCEAGDVGSSNAVVTVSMANATDSGPGALLLKCTQRNARIDYPPGDCGRANFAIFPETEQLYTTGISTAEVLHPCAGSDAPPNVIPMIMETGQNFDCSQWPNATGPGQFVYTMPSEQGSTVIDGVGDAADAGVWKGQ